MPIAESFEKKYEIKFSQHKIKKILNVQAANSDA